MIQTQTDLNIIHEAINEYFGFKGNQIFRKTRLREISQKRQWFHYLARKLNPSIDVSLNFIGSYLFDVTGNKWTHDSVLHSCKAINNLLDCYSETKETEKDLIYLIKKKREFNKRHQLAVCVDYPLHYFAPKKQFLNQTL